MRRLSPPPIVERAILTAYWLISGYGLRAWRSVAALLLIIAGMTILLWHLPFKHGETQTPDFGKALLFSLQSGLSLSG